MNTAYNGWDQSEAAVDPSVLLPALRHDVGLTSYPLSRYDLRVNCRHLEFWSSYSQQRTPLSGTDLELDEARHVHIEHVSSRLLSLVPHYNAGFGIFTADGYAADVAATLSEMEATTFGEALETRAKMQAFGKFTGTYAAADGNDSTVIGTSNTFEMAVQCWTSEGNCWIGILLTITAGPSSQRFKGIYIVAWI